MVESKGLTPLLKKVIVKEEYLKSMESLKLDHFGSRWPKGQSEKGGGVDNEHSETVKPKPITEEDSESNTDKISDKITIKKIRVDNYILDTFAKSKNFQI